MLNTERESSAKMRRAPEESQELGLGESALGLAGLLEELLELPRCQEAEKHQIRLGLLPPPGEVKHWQHSADQVRVRDTAVGFNIKLKQVSLSQTVSW